MKNIVVIGKSTYDKTQFLLYLAKAIHVVSDSQVQVTTKNSLYCSELNPKEYIEGVDIHYCNLCDNLTVFEKESYDYIIYDFEEIDIKDEYKAFFYESNIFAYSDQTFESIEYNKKIVGSIDFELQDIYLILRNMNYLSKVKEKQISAIYASNCNFKEVLVSNNNEKDNSIMIDNGHNQSLAIRRFSKDFKQYLFNITSIIIGLPDDKKEIKKMYRQLERSK